MLSKLIEQSKLISLEEETHTYSLQNSDIEFQSVTEFIHTFFREFDEVKIANKLTSSHPKYVGLDPKELIKIWNGNRDRGTKVHKQIEDFILKKDSDIYDPKSQQAIQFLIKKFIKNSNILLPELIIYSKELKLAGTIDLVIYNKLTDQISLIDWKTNKKINKRSFRASETGIKWPTQNLPDCNFTHYTLQLSLYKYVLQNHYNIKVNGTFLMHLRDDTYELHKCDYKENIISSMLKEKKY